MHLVCCSFVMLAIVAVPPMPMEVFSVLSSSPTEMLSLHGKSLPSIDKESAMRLSSTADAKPQNSSETIAKKEQTRAGWHKGPDISSTLPK